MFIKEFCFVTFVFKEDLEDIVSKRNETSGQSRLDDVTVERVLINRNELDLSLFEYEKHKNAKKPKTDSKLESSDGVERLANMKHPHLRRIAGSNLFKEMEQSLKKFTQTKEKTDSNLSQIQNAYLEIDPVPLDLTTQEISHLSAEFKESIQKKKGILNKIASKQAKSKARVPNPANIYKWQSVERNNTNLEINSEQCKESMSFRAKDDAREAEGDQVETEENAMTDADHYSVYSFYYNYYFNYYLKQISNK